MSDEGEHEERDAAQARQTGCAVQRALERQRNASLDFLGGLARKYRDDLNLCIRGIGKRLDREVLEGVVTERSEDSREHEREQAIRQRKLQQLLEHR